MAGRKSLESRLVNLWGFDDDTVGDFLEHLLIISIESEDDLLDYVAQLLGSRDDGVKDFVKDVNRFQKGLPIKAQEKETAEPAAVPAKNGRSHQKSGLPEKNNATKPATMSKTVSPAKVEKSVAAVTSSIEKKTSAEEKVEASAEKDAPPKDAPPKESQVAPPPRKKYGLPPKGKAKRVCGCFGTLHKPYTNCLYCGRISCTEEGYDYCAYCGYLVEEVKWDPNEEPNRYVKQQCGLFAEDAFPRHSLRFWLLSSKAKAWQHKERLLRYDRESAKRTVVLDDQADYYNNQNSNWLSEEEQVNAELQDDEQRSNLHQRKKQVLNIAF